MLSSWATSRPRAAPSSKGFLQLAARSGLWEGSVKHLVPGHSSALVKGRVKSLLAQVETISKHRALPATFEEAFL